MLHGECLSSPALANRSPQHQWESRDGGLLTVQVEFPQNLRGLYFRVVRNRRGQDASFTSKRCVGQWRTSFLNN